MNQWVWYVWQGFGVEDGTLSFSPVKVALGEDKLHNTYLDAPGEHSTCMLLPESHCKDAGPCRMAKVSTFFLRADRATAIWVFSSSRGWWLAPASPKGPPWNGMRSEMDTPPPPQLGLSSMHSPWGPQTPPLPKSLLVICRSLVECP